MRCTSKLRHLNGRKKCVAISCSTKPIARFRSRLKIRGMSRFSLTYCDPARRRLGVVWPARTSHVSAIAEILVDTWRTTFRGIVADDFLDAMLYDQQHERLLNILAGEGTTCFVAEVAKVAVGFAIAGPNRGTESLYSGELYAIYVRQSFQARGIGRQLLGAVSRELIAQQRTNMIVWVLAVNPFRAFYERLGAHVFYRQGLMLGTQMVEQTAYVWDDLRALSDRLSDAHPPCDIR